MRERAIRLVMAQRPAQPSECAVLQAVTASAYFAQAALDYRSK